jgi:myo-inositol-1(or 4)-monophosphatase
LATPSALVNVMIEAARKAGKGLIRDFGELNELQVSKKGLADFVSAADIKAEQVVFEALEKARPGYSFLGEERGLIEGTDKSHRWIVDPLDGTTNFLHALPHFAVSIALEREGTLVAGLVYNPVSQDLYWAERGKGAYLNNEKRLRVAGRSRMEDAVLATGIPFLGHGQHAKFLKELHQMSQRVAGVRRFGAAALDLAFVAAGRFDGYWERDLKAWDIAAGMLLVTEAGGKVSEIDNSDANPLDTGSILAANMELHPVIEARLKAAQG